MEMDDEKDGCNGIKPLTLDWDNLLASGDDDDRPPEIIVTKIKKRVDDGGGSSEADKQEQDIELMTKTDREINEFIARQKSTRKMYDKLPDRGEKYKAAVRRHEAELERRNKAKLQKVVVCFALIYVN